MNDEKRVELLRLAVISLLRDADAPAEERFDAVLMLANEIRLIELRAEVQRGGEAF